MNFDDEEVPVTCLDCGAELTPESDRDFEFGASGALCWACAERRGGRYDERRSRWIEAPDVSDLARSAHELD